MRRPWELAHLQQRPAGPRVYVPFSLPDTSAATTFAVLEFVGFSSSPSPPSSSQRPLSPSPSSPVPPPASLCRAQLHASLDSSDAPHSASHTQTSAKFHSESSASEEFPTLLHHAPPATTLCADAATSSWSVVEKSATFNGRSVRVVQTHIKENIVHTTPSNFKDIVQQLTGASSIEASTGRPNAKALITAAPTVLAAAAQVAPNKVPNAFSVKMDVRKGFKKASPKLQERRRDMCNLEKLCANKRLTVSATSTSPLLPSPVTPLAFCTSITPTTSQSSGRSSGVSSPEAPMAPNSSNTPIILSYTPNIAEHCSSKGGAHAICSNLHHYATLMEDHHGTPALLNLFPESSSV